MVLETLPLTEHPENDCFVPSHVKKNFLNNYVKEVDEKCSTTELKDHAHLKLRKRLVKNGHYKIPQPALHSKKKKTNGRKGHCVAVGLY